MSDTFAAIDCGTNSVRLLVRRGDTDLVRRAEITRLGRGVDATGRLGDEGLAATLAVLREYRAQAADLGVESFRVVATSAARDAANADELLGPVRELFGTEAEILDGETEGRWSYAGAVEGLGVADDGVRTLVLDIGGGSCELAVGTAESEGAISLDIGSVRLTERLVEHDPPRAEELSAMLSLVDAHVDEAVQLLPAIAEAERLVGVAGTITTVAAVEIGLLEWDRDRVHGFVLTREAVEDVFRTLATEALADRVHNPGLPAERADVIVAGCCILVAVMRRLGFDECLVSDADLLDHIVADQAGR
ncbi:MAG: Ppx/GppA phosphatase family protein [Actinomycetota bacterium]